MVICSCFALRKKNSPCHKCNANKNYKTVEEFYFAGMVNANKSDYYRYRDKKVEDPGSVKWKKTSMARYRKLALAGQQEAEKGNIELSEEEMRPL